MNVLRHYHVSDQAKSMPDADFVENTDKAITCAGRGKRGAPPCAAEGDEVKIALTVPAFQGVACKRRKPAPLKTKGCGTRALCHYL